MDPDAVEQEKEEAYRNLEKAGWDVRYIISHEMPASTLALFSRGRFKPDVHSQFLEEIRCKTSYSRWFCGHYHQNRMINDRDLVFYEQIAQIW